MARHWFHGRFQAAALPLVKLWAVLRGARLPEGPGSLGGLGPAAMSVKEAPVWRWVVPRSLSILPGQKKAIKS